MSGNPEENLCPLGLTNMRMASWGRGGFSCSGVFAQLQILWFHSGGEMESCCMAHGSLYGGIQEQG